MNEATRAWLYRLVTPITALLTGYGILDDRTAALWAGLAGALLMGGLATLNTSTKPQD